MIPTAKFYILKSEWKSNHLFFPIVMYTWLKRFLEQEKHVKRDLILSLWVTGIIILDYCLQKIDVVLRWRGKSVFLKKYYKGTWTQKKNVILNFIKLKMMCMEKSLIINVAVKFHNHKKNKICNFDFTVTLTQTVNFEITTFVGKKLWWICLFLYILWPCCCHWWAAGWVWSCSAPVYPEELCTETDPASAPSDAYKHAEIIHIQQTPDMSHLCIILNVDMAKHCIWWKGFGCKTKGLIISVWRIIYCLRFPH